MVSIPPASLRDHLEKVHSFSVIARTGSFRKAATVLRRTQPSLSRSVRVLEEALGVALFERSRLGVQPTPAGRELLELSARISTEVSRAEHRLRDRSSGVRAKLFVGSYSSLAIRIWPALAREISRKHPGIAITVKTDCDDERMQQMVRSSKLDLALTIPPSPYPDLVSRGIYTDSFAVYGAPALVRKAFGSGRSVPLSRVAQVPLVSVPSASVPGSAPGEKQNLGRFMHALGLIREQRVHELDSFEAAKEFVAEGVGLALLPRWVARSSVERRELVAIRVPELPEGTIGMHTIHATFRRSDSGNPAIQGIIDEARRLTGSL